MTSRIGARIVIDGVVQGVGFRPFVYDLASRFSLVGWVRNTSAGVEIEVDGTEKTVQLFTRALQEMAPPLARVEQCRVQTHLPNGFTNFEIIHSEPIPGAYQPISPDVGICSDCLDELFDPKDRRFRYPFINCTNCGPRFTIISDIPYDRPLTTMAPFEMCSDCAAEYKDPADRRFHAQPVACAVCGPHIWFTIHGDPLWVGEDALQAARRSLLEGKILAVKGLGGFHLACDATNTETVEKLRSAKLRVDKPFALMMPDIHTVKAYTHLTDADEALLQGWERPIVILKRLESTEAPHQPIAASVAPGQVTIGVMLPYTPLHYLLIQPEPGFPQVLVMTSGNLREEPIAVNNLEAQERLKSLADVYLMHNRVIHTRCDDSVVRVFEKKIYPLRRSRGYAPYPVKLPVKSPPLLATGGELKNAFCLARDHYAFLSHHIGDLENYETLQSFEQGIRHLERLFRVQPEAIAFDLHPDYLATRYAHDRIDRDDMPGIGVQHHHAHIAACMVDHGHLGDRPVIGVAFDGTGFGDDQAIWGGEFLIADYDGYHRAYHLAYTPLPGGDAAARETWRMALAALWTAGLDWDTDLPPTCQVDDPTRTVIRRQIEAGINAPPTSSMGRLFDAVSSLIGICQHANYEAQAAIELEALVDHQETHAYPFSVSDGEIDPSPALREILRDFRAKLPVGSIASRFHNGIAHMVTETCLSLRAQYEIQQVVLSGGVWQNMTLLELVIRLLREKGFTVLTHHQIPTNDGGLAIGQAVVAQHALADME